MSAAVMVPRWLVYTVLAALVGLAVAVVLLFTRLLDGERVMRAMTSDIETVSSQSTSQVDQIGQQVDQIKVPEAGPRGPRGERGPRGYPGVPGLADRRGSPVTTCGRSAAPYRVWSTSRWTTAGSSLSCTGWSPASRGYP